MGSPPQVRGKPHRDCIKQKEGRITPAGAGKTLPFCNISCSLKDHPRRCGENSEPAGKTIVNAGSPPQVRGKLCSQYVQPFSFRITPAGAGKTSCHI